MKFDFRTYIRGGEILESTLLTGGTRAFTRVIPTADAVLTPHEVGDLIAGWAMTMCMRDKLAEIESTFPNFEVVDKLVARDTSRTFTYDSPLQDLHWWEERLGSLIEMEACLVDRQYVGLAVDHPHAMGMVAAIDWFIQRHKCRPPGVGEGLHRYSDALQKETQMQSPSSSATIANLPPVGIDSLAKGDRRAVEAIRVFDESEFDFLGDLVTPQKKHEQSKEDAKEHELARKQAEELGLQTSATADEVDEWAYGAVKAARAVAPDGFREEDRRALDRFRRYVGLAVNRVEPLKARWIDVEYVELGQRLFSLAQLLFTSSFPNAESAKLREEELQATRARAEREAEEEARRTRGGGGGPFN